jgi:hypothetical protein
MSKQVSIAQELFPYIKIFLLGSALLVCTTAFSVRAQEVNPQPYEISNSQPRQIIWVDPNLGSDENSGSTAGQALRSVTAAWNRISANTTLSQGYQINLRAGTYGADLLPNYWENRLGTANAPIYFLAHDGAGTVVFQRDINAFNIKHVYFSGITIRPVPAGDAFHCERCDHVLLRNMILDGGERAAHETLKVNQSQHFYVENSELSGAGDNVIDFVAVQYGHILNNRIHNAGDWCTYVKGGSAYISIANNLVYDCGTGGITAGQGTGFEFMVHPWLRYEAQSIKIFNNIVRDTEGAAFGVNGGLDILVAHNTAYRIGSRSHVFEAVFGERTCDGDAATCATNLSSGGWGPSNPAIDSQPIPNKNVFVFNNIFYNPAGFQSQWQHLAIYGPRTAAGGTNISSPVRTDTNLQIKGNLIWNGDSTMALGIGTSDQGCFMGNSTCNEAQLLADNFINVAEPNLRSPAEGDFRPGEGGNLFTLASAVPGGFDNSGNLEHPVTPGGVLQNVIPRDRSGLSREVDAVIGAYQTSDGELAPGLPGEDVDNDQPQLAITEVRIRPSRRVRVGQRVRIRVVVSGASVSTEVVLRGRNLRARAPREIAGQPGVFVGQIRFVQPGLKRVVIVARDTNTGFEVRERRGVRVGKA